MAAETRTPRHGELDVVLGARIRRRRRELQLSQSALGAELGITFQQIQKYENGSNRVSATMLMKLADALSVSVSELLQEIDPAGAAATLEAESGQLIAAFGKIQSAALRAAVLTLVNGLASR